jgi:OFA family oxalate/formate antiporter-like MFS transporter
MSTAPDQSNASVLNNPWVQLLLGVICMAAVANLQYGWTLFVNPIDAKYHWGRPAIQVAFTLFVLIETWLVPVEGYLVDKYGPTIVVLVGSLLVAIAWVINSVADSLTLLYVAAAIGGIGVGSVYGTCVGNALKWFPGRRGLAAGFTAAGFGAGAAVSIIPIKHMIDTAGYEHAFLTFGIGQGLLVFVMAWGLRVAPAAVTKMVAKPNLSARNFAPMEVLKKPVFWVLYVMFVLVASGVLMMAASLAPIAKDLHIDKVTVEMLGLAMPALPFALTLNRYFDGFGRPFFGWVSDKIGRENTMAIAFSLGALSLYTLSQSGSNATVFVIVTSLYFLVSGEIYSLFPATQGDTFGSKFAAANAGMLYTAKGSAALVVPMAAAIAASSSWGTVFLIAIGFNLVAAGLGLFVLKPMRTRHFSDVRAELENPGNLARVSG